MVLGFGSRKKKPVEEPVVRPSPSLPHLKEQRIPWPENLVDLHEVYALDYPSPPGDGHKVNATLNNKVSFQSTRGPIAFHKPFRESTDQGIGTPKPSNIAALFGTGIPPPPSSFNGLGTRGRITTHPRTASRRAKHAPTFNIMVVGGKKTGKTSFLRLLLSTSNISPTNTPEQLATLASYRSANFTPTTVISTACVEILQSSPNRTPTPEDRIALTCIDTPGLDFTEGKEFVLDRTVSDVLKYLDTQFAETMGEESKVVRTSKGDQHVHLCIYLVDPDSVITPAARQARSRWASAGLNRPKLSEGISEYDSGSDVEEEEQAATADGDEGQEENDDKQEGGDDDSNDEESVDDYGEPEPEPKLLSDDKPETGIESASIGSKTPKVSISQESHIPSPPASPQKSSQKPSQSQSQSQSSAKAESSSIGGDRHRLGMSPAEIRVISRLCKRVNVLPVISHADTLTDDRLKRVKQAVRRDLQAVDGIGIWGVWDAEPGTLPGRMVSVSNMNMHSSSSSGMVAATTNGSGAKGGGDESTIVEERHARPVIKLRGPKRGLTRSRSRKSLKTAVDAEYEEPDIEASPGYPVSPTTTTTTTMQQGYDGSNSRRTSAVSAKTDAGQASYGAIFSRADLRARMPFAIIAPEKERPVKQQQQQGADISENGGYHVLNVYGRFVRKFRWGTIDVLDPHHCDFAALRAAILGSYMKSLKATTRDVLYERFRTEKLLARRATANISEDERKRMIEDLGL
ncbi:hypothetical protein Clacol_009816 [Clathrus columnatus]|uniref:Septin-type G domain-containing protein n=1 Tax=Clathrus columnatus TaxID=1419009 RepID=A0AAV5AS88_9AGAM|nr:hypothetical protein Clacol_009816 [Clathrus columnatus]